MPYIQSSRRHSYRPCLRTLTAQLGANEWNVGDITYCLYYIVWEFFKRYPCYSTICSIRGVLAGTQAEVDRVLAGPYEDEAITRNGDMA